MAATLPTTAQPSLRAFKDVVAGRQHATVEGPLHHTRTDRRRQQVERNLAVAAVQWRGVESHGAGSA
jgi:hypothetical protein